jgi:hypothetical protein
MGLDLRQRGDGREGDARSDEREEEGEARVYIRARRGGDAAAGLLQLGVSAAITGGRA